ncbi:MAG: disulfide bond formation protein B [Rhodoferax sp.]|uniref:disulfide bond formation protein B n=1 Tax=Rhodoferax sp. TaxID=50421 RepID=UPI0026276129|nr:disulfide bond formation protein B [Rhodoferax sp.]MDD5333907.1 disulfide bond formation protein B [Rhodoferax sp.]
MFQTIKSLSLQRWPWLLLAAVALALDGTALTLQHVFNVPPCNECIYIRLGVLGVGVAGLLGALAPRVPAFRLAGLAVWMGALGWSLYRANLLLNLERVVREGGATGCARFKGFPSWLALDAWLPAMFEPRAMCGDVSWTFLGQSVTFWIWVALWCLALTAALVLVAQKMTVFPAPAVDDSPGFRPER